MIRRKNRLQELKENDNLKLWQNTCTKIDIFDDGVYFYDNPEDQLF